MCIRDSDTNMKFSSELFLVAGNVIQNYYAAGGSLSLIHI